MFKAALNRLVPKKLRIKAAFALARMSAPPPETARKQELISRFGLENGADTLVETGTYLGHTIRKQMDRFKDIYSIEIVRDLYDEARREFRSNPKVHLYCGDSGKELRNILREIPGDRTVLFWLDGHFSGGITGKGDENSPILQELDAVVSHIRKKCLILIDDARCFSGKGGYPTLEKLRQFFADRNRGCDWNVEDDVIRIVLHAQANSLG